MSWLAFSAVVVASLVLVGLAAVLAGRRLWNSATSALHAELAAARREPPVRRYAIAELQRLPAPVQRYFRAALKPGQPVISAVSLAHQGTFNVSATAPQWRPFRSTQRVVVHLPGFVWDGRVEMLKGLPVCVHDAYIAGEGVLHPAFLGLVSLTRQRGGGELARGELMRFLAEAAWYPTALLPSHGVHWEPIDDGSARATLIDGDVGVTLTFHFNEHHLIDTVRADRRARMTGARLEHLPWQGRFWNYAERSGMQVPLEGEVAWITAQGPQPYWRGTLASIGFEFASSAGAAP
jgi:hypothetical protein